MREFQNQQEAEPYVLGQELLRRHDEDQAMRQSGSWNLEVDARNTERMKEIVASSGWPTISMVGEKAARAAWLLVQHADQDPQFQAQCLALMRQLPPEEVDKEDIAFLEDRVRVNTDRPTLYGTQFYEDENDNFGPRPIEDPEHLDERRAAMGLVPFAEHQREIDLLRQKTKE